ncbi:MAG: adenylyltransferase/cytidyltransferase family protein [Alphaproteobacteria bacterium]|nr:adenylyltransferase/cytidyltransferase family protein [Alphaproteobacteria bacterium]
MSQYKYKHGLTIMRAQPFHIGHQKLVDQMLKECERVTIALGSIQEQGTSRNPFNYTTRKKMIQNVYRETSDYDRLKIIGLFDINNPAEWGTFVMDFIKESFSDIPLPDAYYAGSEYDAHWFKDHIKNICLVNRTDPNFPFVTASMVRDMIKFGDERWKNFVSPRNFHIIEEYFDKKKGII